MIPHRRQIGFWTRASSSESSHLVPSLFTETQLNCATRLLATLRALAGLRHRGGLLNRLVGMSPESTSHTDLVSNHTLPLLQSLAPSLSYENCARTCEKFHLWTRRRPEALPSPARARTTSEPTRQVSATPL